MAKVKVRVSMLADPIEVDESEIQQLIGEGIFAGMAAEDTAAAQPDGGQTDSGVPGTSRRTKPAE